MRDVSMEASTNCCSLLVGELKFILSEYPVNKADLRFIR